MIFFDDLSDVTEMAYELRGIHIFIQNARDLRNIGISFMVLFMDMKRIVRHF